MHGSWNSLLSAFNTETRSLSGGVTQKVMEIVVIFKEILGRIFVRQIIISKFQNFKCLKH